MTCATIIEVIASGIIGFFTALFGAGAGAYAAYLLALKQQRDNAKDTQYRAATSAMLTLYSRFMVLQTFRSKSMTEDGASLVTERETSIIAHYCPDTKLDFASLSFLADQHDSHLVHNLGLSEANYFNFVEALGERNKYITDLVSRFFGEDRYSSDGKAMITLKAHEKHLIAAQNRNLVEIAGIALDLTKLNLVGFHELFERRFTGLPVFSPSTKTKREDL